MTKYRMVWCTLILVLVAGCGAPAPAIPPSTPGAQSGATGQAATPGAQISATGQASLDAANTATATFTSVPPSPANTATAAFTSVPPTAANTATATFTSVPPTAVNTATSTFTPVPPSLTPTPTKTPTPAPQSIQHAISVVNARDIYHIHLANPGKIQAHVTWTGSQGELSLIINGPGQVSYFARQDGASALDVSYIVTPANFAAGRDWTVTVASFGAGQATGTVSITYPSGSSVSPFQDQFNISTNYGGIVQVLVLKHAGPIQAQATWTGTPATMALIINGPGQVGYFARQDGGSPVNVSYPLTPANFAAGDTWRVSLASFSPPNATGTLKVTFP